jgi:hypothetical protein
MTTLNDALLALEALVLEVSSGAELSHERVLAITEKSHKLLEQINKAIHTAKLKDLEDYINNSILLAQQLHQVAQEKSPESSSRLINPRQIFQGLYQGYKRDIEPVIQKLEKDLDQTHKQHGKQIEQLSLIAGLCSEVFVCSTAVRANWDVMNKNEKVAAALGVVLMFAGIGLLIAAVANPVTVPIVAAVVVVTVGCYLCRWAVAKHKNEHAEQIRHSSGLIPQHLDKISDSFNVKSEVKPHVKFSKGPQPEMKAEEKEVEEPALNTQPNITRRLEAGFNAFFNPTPPR